MESIIMYINGAETVIVGDGHTISLDRQSSQQVKTYKANDIVTILKNSQESDLIRNITNGYMLVIDNYSSLYPSDFASENCRVVFSKDFGLNPVVLHKDLTTAEIFEVLKETSEKDFTGLDCFICAIAANYSTSDEMIMGTDEVGAIHIDTLLDFFLTIPSLKNKPKVFLIQTMQVPTNDCTPSATYACEMGAKGNVENKSDKPQRRVLFPADSNLLVYHATLPSYDQIAADKSFCGLLKFVVDVFRSHADKEHLVDMITRVNSQITQSDTSIKVRCLHACTKKFYFLHNGTGKKEFDLVA